GTVTLHDCRFAGAYAWRDEAGGCEGDWEGGCGLHVCGEAVLEVARCEFTACVYGIRLREGTATIHSCHLHHLQAVAIGIDNSARGDVWIHHCRIHDTTSEAFGEGIVFEGTGAGCIEHNECHAHRKAGIRWGGGAGGGTVAGNHCHDNGLGIVVEQRGWPEVIDNRCERNEAGVLCRDHASPLVRGNVLANNHDGIAVPGRHYRLNNTFPSPRIEHNQVRGNTHGIYYGGMATGFARSNVIEGSVQAAVVLDDRANPCVTDNTIKDNPGAAIALKGLAAGLVFENRIASNGGPDLVEEESCVTLKHCPQNWARVRAYWRKG
ncbi:MAG: right-handed parallel beta-helix repeat-containing protein, partial [Candidatus Sericytochromatia bacterium]|nr:right-handed parallel beta-helix repeat-containing protein [Candidatus Sericytochromatia bacterium]